MTHAKLRQAAEAATPGPWDRMPGRGLVRAIRDDLAVPLFEPLEPYSDPLLDAPTCRVGGEVVFRANSQAARESAAIRQGVHNAAFIALANPAAVLALLDSDAEKDAAITRLEAELSAARAGLKASEAFSAQAADLFVACTEPERYPGLTTLTIYTQMKSWLVSRQAAITGGE